jgi:hypothetical protein
MNDYQLLCEALMRLNEAKIRIDICYDLSVQEFQFVSQSLFQAEGYLRSILQQKKDSILKERSVL